MTTIVKLQKIGNSIRATIPKEIVDDLSLREGEDMVVAQVDDSILFRKRKGAGKTDRPSQFFGKLKAKTGEVHHWPSPEEIKSIWE
jgi:antitoxin component of MazEF toxin-antitoxin module